MKKNRIFITPFKKFLLISISNEKINVTLNVRGNIKRTTHSSNMKFNLKNIL